ncbi:MAG: hypothetical protein JXR91_15950 [Deltaproteobacteria bacterium]|nr:hypothetical protein [Deltaproteobacteria bacterium]
MIKSIRNILILSLLIMMNSCGAAQVQTTPIELQPLEEFKALEIIRNTLALKGYKIAPSATVTLSNNSTFNTDISVVNEQISVEYVTEQDTRDKGYMPATAAGSRLHVLPATIKISETVTSPTYILILNEDQYMYHARPTPDLRAPVTYHEVENRLIRDLNDFLSWYEKSAKAQQ